MGFSRQEYWSGFPFPSPGDLPDPGIEPRSPVLQADALPTEPPGKPICMLKGSSFLILSSLWQPAFLFFFFFVPVNLIQNMPAVQETWVQSLGGEGPLEKGIATHFNILAWRIPWTKEPGGLQSMGSQRVGHDLSMHMSL